MEVDERTNERLVGWLVGWLGWIDEWMECGWVGWNVLGSLDAWNVVGGWVVG